VVRRPHGKPAHGNSRCRRDGQVGSGWGGVVPIGAGRRRPSTAGRVKPGRPVRGGATLGS
jgi:hypothetical protein